MVVDKIRLADLAKYLHAQLHGDGDIVITGVASIHSAKIGKITFLKDYRLKGKLRFCAASAVILSEDHVDCCNIAALVVKDPYLAYIKTAKLMHVTPKLNPNIASDAVVASDAILGQKISIGNHTVLESGVVIGDNVIIGSGSFIGKDTKIGTGTYLWPNVTIHHTVEIGKYCVIKSGSVIGSDGFGHVYYNKIWIKVPQLGKVKIGDHVEIGACTTVDRGALDDTCVENGVIIDNQCQIAHNVVIGQNTAIAGGVIVAGSVNIGKCCMIGGASVINGHINISDKVIITGMSMVIKSITQSGIYSSGIPVQPNMVWRRTAALVMRITYMYQRIKNMEKKLKTYHARYLKITGMVCFFILLGLTGFILLMRYVF